MTVFTVHQPSPRKNEEVASPDRFAFVRDGFYFWAFLLGPLWMFWNRLWLVLVIYLAGTAAIQAALWALGVSGVVKFAVAVLIANTPDTVGQQPEVAHHDPMLDSVMRATSEFAGGSITVRQRERFQDFHDLLVILQIVPSGRLACLATTSRTGRNTTGADARSSTDFQRGQNH